MADKQLSLRSQRRLRLQVARRIVATQNELATQPKRPRSQSESDSEAETTVSKRSASDAESDTVSVGSLQSSDQVTGSEGSGCELVTSDSDSDDHSDSD